MKLNRKIILILCCVVSIVGLLTGCAMLPKNKIAKSATNYNLVVERVGNEMLLLNIVRASKRHPMYFTGLNLLRGSVSYEISTGQITIPFGKIGSGYHGAYTAVSPTLGYSSNPVFDVVVLDNKDFYNAMMTTVPLETIDYFLQQGWPREMLLHLFVRRIDHTKNGEILYKYQNYPENIEEFEKFQNKLREIFSGEWNIEAKMTPTLIGNKVNAKDAADLKKLIEVAKAGLDLKQNQLISNKIDYEFHCRDKNRNEIQVRVAEPGSSLSVKEEDKNKDVYILHLRSPEAILYYLGEIMRVELNTDYIPTIRCYADRCKGKPDAPLFVVHKKTYKDISPYVAVTYEGTKYVIPRSPDDESDDGCSIDRSMHVLSFISLIIGKQKTYGQIPTTGVVSTIGR